MTETKDGYKYVNGFGSIPEDWKVKILKDIVIESRLGGNYTNIESKTKKYLIKMGNIGRGKILLEGLNYIDESEEINKDDLLKEGDLLFNTRNSLELVGKVAVWRNELKEAYYNSNLMRLRFNSEDVFSNYFMNYVFNSYQGLCQLRSFAIGTTSVVAIYNKDLMKFKVVLPTLVEQQKIVSILSIWDEAIGQTEKRITEKKIQRKALMQKLLTEKRFQDFKWKEFKLDKILKLTCRPVEKPNISYKAIGIRSYGKGTFDKVVDDPSNVGMDTLYEIKENDLIVNITFAWEGAIAIVKKSDEGKLVSHRFPTYEFKTDIAIHEYFRYVIIQPKFTYLLQLISPGGAGRNRVMSKKDFLKLKVRLPSIGEQKAIANILNLADREIELLDQKLQELKTQKKGLMQKILTGKIRVKA